MIFNLPCYNKATKWNYATPDVYIMVIFHHQRNDKKNFIDSQLENKPTLNGLVFLYYQVISSIFKESINEKCELELR